MQSCSCCSESFTLSFNGRLVLIIHLIHIVNCCNLQFRPQRILITPPKQIYNWKNLWITGSIAEPAVPSTWIVQIPGKVHARPAPGSGWRMQSGKRKFSRNQLKAGTFVCREPFRLRIWEVFCSVNRQFVRTHAGWFADFRQRRNGKLVTRATLKQLWNNAHEVFPPLSNVSCTLFFLNGHALSKYLFRVRLISLRLKQHTNSLLAKLVRFLDGRKQLQNLTSIFPSNTTTKTCKAIMQTHCRNAPYNYNNLLGLFKFIRPRISCCNLRSMCIFGIQAVLAFRLGWFMWRLDWQLCI